MPIPRYKTLINYTMPRSGSNLFRFTLRRYLTKLSPNEYTMLGEFFNVRPTRLWFTNLDNYLIRHGKKKPNLPDLFTLRFVYENNLLFRDKDYGSDNKVDCELEKNRLLEIWNESQKDGYQKYFFKLFPHHISPDFVTKLNTDDTFFIVLLRKDFRKMTLSRIIAGKMDKWSHKDTKWEHIVKYDFPERNSITVDMNLLESHLMSMENFYKNIKGLNNKFILNYSDIGKTETMVDLMQHIYEDDILETKNLKEFEKLNKELIEHPRIIPTPYTMDHIDYIKNKDEVLKKFEEFDEINEHYMNLYGIK